MTVSGLTWNSEMVMGRHRVLKAEGYDGLTASRIVRFEFVGDIPDPRTEMCYETPGVTKPLGGVSSRGGRPKKHEDAASRQRAYRGRRG